MHARGRPNPIRALAPTTSLPLKPVHPAVAMLLQEVSTHTVQEVLQVLERRQANECMTSAEIAGHVRDLIRVRSMRLIT